jgi:hypothetical protein
MMATSGDAMRVLMCVCILFISFSPAIAQNVQSKDVSQKPLREQWEELLRTQPIANLAPCTSEACQKALDDYYASALGHRKRTLEWQFTSTKLIFGMVLLLVTAGLVFAGLQFFKSFQSPAQQKGATDQVPNVSITTLEASLQGIKISSSVLGLI